MPRRRDTGAPHWSFLRGSRSHRLIAGSDRLTRFLPGSLRARAALAATGALLGVCVVAGAVLRFAQIDTQPGGLYQDEAAEGFDAWRILHEPGFHPLFFADDGGREVLFGYIVAGAFRVAGDSVAVLRGTAAALGLMAVALTPLMLRRYGRLAMVGGTAWAAGSLWMVCVDRDGMRNVTVPLVGTLALWALFAWNDQPDSRRLAILAGLACALGLWTYQPLKLLPVLVGLWLLWLWRSDREAFAALRPQLPAAVIAYAVVAAPIAVAAVMDPTSYFGRGITVSAANPEQGGLGGVPLHSLDTLAMFGILGDPNARHDVAAAPLLPAWLTILAALGAWRAWGWRRADPGMRLVLLGVPVFLLPGLVALEGAAPHGLRLLGLAPFCAALVGLGCAELVDVGRALFGGGGVVGAAALAGVALAATAALSASAYFTRPVADRYGPYSFGLVALGDAARERPRSVVLAGDYDALTIDFIARGTGVRTVPPGSPVGPLPARTPVLSGSGSDLARGVGVEAVAHPTVLATDPWGTPVVWLATAS